MDDYQLLPEEENKKSRFSLEKLYKESLASPEQYPDPNEEAKFWDNEAEQQRLLGLQLKNSELAQTLKHRNTFGLISVGIVSIWLIYVCVVVGIVACGIWSLSDTVLITLLTTTTINIIGLMVIILKFLFPSRLIDKA